MKVRKYERWSYFLQLTACSWSEKSVLTLKENGAKLCGNSCKHRKKEGLDGEQGLGDGLGGSGTSEYGKDEGCE